MKKGFTVIELMIVVAIIIILASISIPNYLRLTLKARVASIESDLKAIGVAIENYKLDWLEYPTGTWEEVKKELLGLGIQNNSSNTNITGERGGIAYINENSIKSFENKLIPNGTVVYEKIGGVYKITVKVSIDEKSYTFILDNGGLLVLEQS